MKKLFYGVALAVTLVACNKEISRHQIAVIYPSFNGQKAVYADHTQDSIILLTFDSYRSIVYGADDWFTLDPVMKDMEVKYSYDNMYRFVIPVEMDVNATGSSRTARVDINNYGVDWNQTVSTGFHQYGWLEVSRPMPVYVTSEDNQQRKALFELKDSATQVADSIEFRTEKAWTLTSKQNLVTMDKTSGEGGEEYTMVKLSLLPNLTDKECIDTLLLQSSGVITPIYVKQAAAKKEE